MGKAKDHDLILERVNRLFSMAQESFSKAPERSHHYMEMIRKLSMRTNFRLPPAIKRRICGNCHHLLVPGRNARFRTSEKQRSIIVTCGDCGHVMRYPYRKEKSKFNKTRKTNNK